MKRTKLTAALGLATVVALTLSACARGGGGTSGGAAPDDELLITTPAAKGEVDLIKWNNPYGEPYSVDPLQGTNYPENLITANLCDTLFQQQPDMTIEPHLAESFEVSEDLKSYVFQIRQGVTFWDGSPLTAADVAFSLQRHMNPEEGSVWSSSGEKMQRVEVTGEHEVTVTLFEPDAIFPDNLASPFGAVVSREYREAAGADFGNPEALVMCSGPFRAVEWKQGQSILLERYDGYWKTEKRAKARQVEIGFVADPTAIGAALASGEIQGSYDVPLPALAQLSQSTSGTLYNGAGAQLMAVISTGNGAFGDPAVRRALTLATDRQAIADTVYEGTARPAKSILSDAAWAIYPEAASLRSSKLPSFTYDIEAAKAALAEAKVDLSQPIRIAYPSERGFYADILNEMANGAKELGLTLEPVGVPGAQFGPFFSDPKAREGYDGFVTTNYPASSEPLRYLWSIAGTGSTQNFNGFSDAELDAVFAAAFAETEPKKALELTVQAEAMVMEQLPWVPVVALNSRLYMNNEITGAPASFVYLNYPWAADLGAAQ